MADESNQAYPKLSKRAWWSIREKFQATLPSTPISKSYLASILDINERSAANYLSALKTLTLLDDDGRPTDRAERFRHDDTYAEVCEEIRQQIYPAELLNVAPTANDRTAAERWFARDARVGQGAARQMATMYQVLLEADPTLKPDLTKSSSRRKARDTKAKSIDTKRTETEKAEKQGLNVAYQSADVPVSTPLPHGVTSPSLHIDIQIHIDADASSDQIDQIFASMAKHLYQNKGK